MLANEGTFKKTSGGGSTTLRMGPRQHRHVRGRCWHAHPDRQRDPGRRSRRSRAATGSSRAARRSLCNNQASSRATRPMSVCRAWARASPIFRRSPRTPASFRSHPARPCGSRGLHKRWPSHNRTREHAISRWKLCPSATGTLDVQLGGAPSAGKFGKLSVTGSATLAGALEADLESGYSPSVGDSFKVVSDAGISGGFTTVNLPETSAAFFKASVSSTAAVLRQSQRRRT